MNARYIFLLLIFVQVNLFADNKKCYCEERITGGHISYSYYVGTGQGCCSGTAEGMGFISTWATDNYGNEWIVDDEIVSSSTVQSNCCENA